MKTFAKTGWIICPICYETAGLNWKSKGKVPPVRFSPCLGCSLQVGPLGVKGYRLLNGIE